MHNIISVNSLSTEWIKNLFKIAKDIAINNCVKTVKGKSVAAIFFENSTRTMNSFKLAAFKQNINFLDVAYNNLSLIKGESFVDTVRTFENLGVNCFVIRQNQSGFCEMISKMTKCHIINGGDGSHQHPTQALADAFSIHESVGQIQDLNIGICGDILHSRVARSNIDLLTLLGAQITLIGPTTLVPLYLQNYKNVSITHDLDSMIIKKLDIIMMLRLQQERMQGSFITSLDDYASRYMLTLKLLENNYNLKIMHPGPTNWNVEIAEDLQQHPNSLIDKQVTNGVYIREAIFAEIL